MVEVERKEGKGGEEDEERTEQLFAGKRKALNSKRERFKARQSGRLEEGELESRIRGSNAGGDEGRERERGREGEREGGTRSSTRLCCFCANHTSRKAKISVPVFHTFRRLLPC